MNKELKSHIRKLAKKFNHEIEYQNDIVILKSEMNEIELWEPDKYGVNISYNLSDNNFDKLKVEHEGVYDILIDLFGREKGSKLTLKNGVLLTIEEWIKEEGEFAKEKFEELKKDLLSVQIEVRELGGNRYEAEYYDGLLILKDDLCWAKSNVIPIPS